MERFVKGDVVVVPFPFTPLESPVFQHGVKCSEFTRGIKPRVNFLTGFTDLTQAKRRPALVIAELESNDLILCQITSQTIRDKYAVSVSAEDFREGSLN